MGDQGLGILKERERFEVIGLERKRYFGGQGYREREGGRYWGSWVQREREQMLGVWIERERLEVRGLDR